MNEAQLLASIRTRDDYEKHSKFLRKDMLLAETRTLVEDFGEFFKMYPKENEVTEDTFMNWFRVCRHPTMKLEKFAMYNTIVRATISATPDANISKRFIELEYAAKLKDEVDNINKGVDIDASFRRLEDTVKEYQEKMASKDNLSGYVVDMDLARLVSSIIKGHGISWRLEELNISVGQLHKSDFIMVGKRPEVGGTTFLLSEVTHMLSQLPEGKNAIIFNNEEGGDKLGLRLIQAALGITTVDIESTGDMNAISTRYQTYLSGRRIDIVHKTDVTTWEIEKHLSGGEYFLIGMNTLSKIRSPWDGEDDIKRREKLANWARNLADKHGVIIAIEQADLSAEGVPYLTQNQLYGSKTTVQGETDVLIMIGAVHDPGKEYERYLSICRNKKPTTGKMEPTLKHGKFVVSIDPERCRYVGK